MIYDPKPADMYKTMRQDDRLPEPVPLERQFPDIVPGRDDRDKWPEGLPFPTEDQIRHWQEEIGRMVWEKKNRRDLPN
ncbi:hypothetical protein JW968_04000 [Candidatus Woesearchaeota archaeon]|nr:hypothetical protein [Candidatus Woesearchaeota archaeon]